MEPSNNNSSNNDSSVDFNSSSGNKNSNSKKLKRIQFKFGSKTYKFTLNPDTYVQTENGKVTVTKTKGGAFVEMFGADIPEIEISGTTGFKNGTGDPDNGYRKFKELRDLIKSVYDNITDGSSVSDSNLLWFYNYTDNEYYKTIPDKFELSRSKSQPHLYKYTIHLYCIRRIGEQEPSTTVQTIGNPIVVENTTQSIGGSSNVAQKQ